MNHVTQLRITRYGALKLRQALQTVCSAYTLREGLYYAYVNDLQWLEEIEDLPADTRSALRRFVSELTRLSGPDKLANVRTTLACLDEERVCGLVERLIDMTLAAEGVATEADIGPIIVGGRKASRPPPA